MKPHRQPQTCSRNRAEFLERGVHAASPHEEYAAWISIPIGFLVWTLKRHECRAPKGRRSSPATAFTLTELLIVIAILTLLAATQLPALTGAKAPVGFTQCMNNLRQIGQATFLYKDNYNDTFPVGQRVPGGQSFAIETGWPRLILRFSGGYQTNIQPVVYICPLEKQIVPGASFQLHYWANRYIVSDDVRDVPDGGVRGSAIRNPNAYWMFSDKDAYEMANIDSSALIELHLNRWNVTSYDSPGMRRHSGGLNTVAADGHADWLRMPPYRPGTPPPGNFLELGDCVNGVQGSYGNWTTNGPRVKLWTRYSRVGDF